MSRNCECAACCEANCICEDADWSTDEEIRLRAEVEALRARIRKEIDHAVLNGHRLAADCQGAPIPGSVGVVRIDHLEAALGGGEKE